MTRVAFIAERMGHHPGIYNTYSYVRLELHTHDEGGIVTEKDRKLAREIDRILA